MTLDPSQHDQTSDLLGDFDASERPMVTPIVQGLVDRMSRASLDDAARDRIARTVRGAIAEKADRAEPSRALAGPSRWGSLLRLFGSGLAGAAVALLAVVIILPSFYAPRSETVTGTMQIAPDEENLRGRSSDGATPQESTNAALLRSEDVAPLDVSGAPGAAMGITRDIAPLPPIAAPAPAPLATGSEGDLQGGTTAQKAALTTPQEEDTPIFRVRPSIYRVVQTEDPSSPGTTLEIVDLPMFTPRELEEKLQALVSARGWVYDPAGVHLEYDTQGDYILPNLVFSGPDGTDERVVQAMVVDLPSRP